MTAYFVSNERESQVVLEGAVQKALGILQKYWWSADKPYNTTKRTSFRIPELGGDLGDIIEAVGKDIIVGGINVSHSKAIAHMHCLPTISSIVAELIIGATNQSLDSWDESPVATYVEQEVIKEFCNLVGYNEQAGGIVDSGGTMSNQTAVLLARDSHIADKYGVDVKEEGIPPEVVPKLRIICSEEAHFTIEKAAAVCGLGSNAVVKVPVTEEFVMDVKELEKYVLSEKKKGNEPFLVVATAGKTNSGNIPNLKAVGEIARKNGIWYHVDAAYGGGLLFSDKYKHLLEGIEGADSITFDPHKLLYQSVSCGLFLLRDRRHFRHLTFHSEYLNPESDAQEGIVNLVDQSLQTTRRFDALKLYMSLQHLGRRGFDEVITSTVDRTQRYATLIKEAKDFELAVWPHTNILLFRYLPNDSRDANVVNDEVQKRMYHEGKGILSRTKVRESTYLKATCMNPHTTEDDFTTILSSIREVASNTSR